MVIMVIMGIMVIVVVVGFVVVVIVTVISRHDVIIIQPSPSYKRLHITIRPLHPTAAAPLTHARNNM